MDQQSLSLKFFKRRKNKEKKISLFLKRQRIYKENSRLYFSREKPFYSKCKPLRNGQSSLRSDSNALRNNSNKNFKSKRKFLVKNKKRYSRENVKTVRPEESFIKGLYLSKRGQIVIEGLFFLICILFFVLSIQSLQFLVRKEIQDVRLTQKKTYKIKKNPWLKN